MQDGRIEETALAGNNASLLKHELAFPCAQASLSI